MSETSDKTYQPGWGENKKHHHHHHTDNRVREQYRGMGGAVRMRDKQAYYGLVLVIVLGLGLLAYKIFAPVVRDLREMPLDDPASEWQVDELRIHKVQEQDALLAGDSLAQEYRVDSIRRQVQIETVPVYRPPRRENVWYITKRDWKALWRNYKLWKWQKNREEQENDDNRR